ncbi:MAG: hypothetical protein KAI22_04525, partial [Gammaproteobacteria bacterium]|nr:hypothetical protein [Gammaproteobacteria bacterium]
VLITAIAVFKLWGLRWGIAALSALILTWHQPDAPQLIWINLIIAAALLRALPAGGAIYKLIKNYYFAVAVILALLILPFIVSQARIALYPQLEFRNAGIQYSADSNEFERMNAAPDAVLQSAAPVSKLRQAGSVSSYLKDKSYSYRTEKSIAKIQMDSIDPNAMIQTGPGLPSWTLNQYAVHWDGPVRSEQQISLLLISPAVNSLLNVLRILFVLLLAWRLIDISHLQRKEAAGSQVKKTSGSDLKQAPGNVLSSLTLFLVTGLLFLAPQISQASFPTKDLLDELRNELSKPAECLPHCADIESLSIDLSAQKMTLKLLVHTQEDVSIPLPVPLKQWQPDNILIDGEYASGLFRQNNPVLWLFLARGSHSVEISGRVEHLQQLQISFPLKPHHIRLAVEDWSAEGMDQDISKISALSFVKLNKDQKALAKIEQSDIPAYAELTRTLNLGQSWHITTQIRGVWGSSYPIILKIPLMAGESVLSDNVKIEQDYAIITLQRKNATVQWHSKLAISQQIKLKAMDSEQIIEHWVLNTSPIWHIEHSGIPVIYHQRQGERWQPVWQPWPKEEVIINVTRPAGVKGKTITIDSSELTITPGEQNTAAELKFNLRSSLGGQHSIHLPDNALLQSVSINNKNMPIRNTREGLSLPVLPGSQKIKVAWHEPRGISGMFHTSELNLGSDSVNNKITLIPGSKRWILLTSGPAMGPAVLFWGVFVIILILSYGLGRIKGTPLSTLQWLLLWVGLSASEPLSAIVIVVCIFALKVRGSIEVKAMKAISFNALQILLVVLVMLSITALIVSIEQGLLGSPRMQISGNGSSAYQLNWFSDRIAPVLPEAGMISVPVYIYRLIMLAWSIWLAFAVIKWAQWGWAAFSHEEYWQSLPKRTKFKKKSTAREAKVKDKLFIDEDDISV